MSLNCHRLLCSRGSVVCNSQGKHIVFCHLARHDTRAESLTALSLGANYRHFWDPGFCDEGRQQYQRETICAFSWVRQPNGHVLVRVPVDGGLPSVLVVRRVRWFRDWGGREGTYPVSCLVSVGGFVSFDSSNGAQARMKVSQRPYDKQQARDKTDKLRRRLTQRNARRSREAEQRSTEKPAAKYSLPCTSRERKET